MFCLSNAALLLLFSIFSDDAEFLWRLARASRDLALLPDINAEQKKRLTYEAFDYAKKALEKNEACFAAHKVLHYVLWCNRCHFFFWIIYYHILTC